MRTPLLLVTAVLASSCSTLRLELGDPLDLQSCASFELGSTRRAEVLEALGPPMALATYGDGVALLYEYILLKERQLGIGLDTVGTFLGIPELALLKISLGRSGSRREAALFLFDAEGVLSGSTAGPWEEVFGKGGGMQILFNVEQVVDTGTLGELPRGLTWGTELLESLPATLNQAHRADLELRGQPEHAGQHTLE